MAVGTATILVQSFPDEEEGFWTRQYDVVVYDGDQELARTLVGINPPNSIEGYVAEDGKLGVVVIRWEAMAKWYVWDDQTRTFEEMWYKFAPSKYYDRLKTANPKLPDK